MKKIKGGHLCLPFFVALLLFACTPADDGISISPEEAARIGNRIFDNECGGRSACLTSWNAGEAFPSLGIGHFIWYPAGTSGPFNESFPQLLAFMKGRKTAIPHWLDAAVQSGAPWPSREAFLAAQHSDRMQELRSFLAVTKTEQTRFMILRMQLALPQILKSVPASQRQRISFQFRRLAAAPMGYYPLVDYVNFKGEGIRPEERYRGQGWGLLQVLQAMASPAEQPDALAAFAQAAKEILIRRVANAPAERDEKRWLPGWLKRISSYAADEVSAYPEPDSNSASAVSRPMPG